MIRPATAGDYEVFVRLFRELGTPDPVPTAERFAAGIVPVMSVCDEAGEAIGYATWRSYGALAHVMQVTVDPAHRGRRIGEQLLHHVRDQARAAGCTRWYLNVKRDNTPALRLYERCGFAFELETSVMAIAWDRLPPIAVRDDLAAPGDDVAIAAKFPIPLERLAMFRAREWYRMVILRDDAGAIIGAAPFDPNFPGTPAFCAERPELAHALLEAIRRHADPQFDFVRVAIEGDRALADAVLALGATPTFDLLRLSASM